MGLLEQAGMPQEGAQPPQPAQSVEPAMTRGNEDPDISPQAQPFIKRGVEILYRDNFEKLVQMIKGAGPDGLGASMSTAINTTMEKLKQEGQMPPDVAVEVGATLFTMLLEDLVSGGTIEQISEQQMADAIGQTLRDYADANPEELSREQVAQALAAGQQELSAQMPQAGQAQAGQPNQPQAGMLGVA